MGFSEPWLHVDSRTAHFLWNDHTQRRRAGLAPKRLIADVLIAAFALRFQGIITRNRSDFAALAPTLKIVVP